FHQKDAAVGRLQKRAPSPELNPALIDSGGDEQGDAPKREPGKPRHQIAGPAGRRIEPAAAPERPAEQRQAAGPERRDGQVEGVAADRREGIFPRGGRVARQAAARRERHRGEHHPAAGALREAGLLKRDEQREQQRAVELAPEPDVAALGFEQVAAENVERRRRAAGELRALNDERGGGDQKKSRGENRRERQKAFPQRSFARRQNERG